MPFSWCRNRVVPPLKLPHWFVCPRYLFLWKSPSYYCYCEESADAIGRFQIFLSGCFGMNKLQSDHFLKFLNSVLEFTTILLTSIIFRERIYDCTLASTKFFRLMSKLNVSRFEKCRTRER